MSASKISREPKEKKEFRRSEKEIMEWILVKVEGKEEMGKRTLNIK